jgi:hypothetical protein
VASPSQVDEAAAAIEILPSSETSTIAAQHIITLGPWSEVRRRTPYPVSYTLDVSKLRGMEDGKVYHFEVGTRESEDALQSRIRWWRFRSELAQHPDLTSPGESLSPKVSYSLGMSRFKAVAQLAIPPRFEYRISIQPTTVSLSNPTGITVSVEVTLKAASIYTVYSERLTYQPHTTVLHDRINLFCFDLVGLEVISGEARDVDGTRAGAPDFPANLGRQRFREFIPEKVSHEAHIWVPGEGPNELTGRFKA